MHQQPVVVDHHSQSKFTFYAFNTRGASAPLLLSLLKRGGLFRFESAGSIMPATLIQTV